MGAQGCKETGIMAAAQRHAHCRGSARSLHAELDSLDTSTAKQISAGCLRAALWWLRSLMQTQRLCLMAPELELPA